MNSSRYVQITDWALLEYEYANEPIEINKTGALLLKNNYTNSFQFLNKDIAKNITGNVLDNSSAIQNAIGNKWAFLDIDTVIPVWQQDNKLQLFDKTNELTGNFIHYDKIKLHVVAGYNLEGTHGIIAQVQIKDRENQNLILANYTFLPSENSFNFNPKPIFLGDKLYDKYIEFKIPSLNFIALEFDANKFNTGSFGYVYSKNGTGFSNKEHIEFILHEITHTETINGNKFFVTGNKYETNFLPVDQFNLLSAVIKESTAGDFFEYYAAWDGKFPEDYIARLNEAGGDWVIIHRLEVFEQVGTNFYRTFNSTILQDSNFDRPMLFRPVILNAHTAFAFHIDYTMRFMNKVDGNQIIRRASLTSYEPKKYGKQIERINLTNAVKPLKVYNKILNPEKQINKISYVQNSENSFKTITQTKYVPTFFNNTNIAISTDGYDTQELDGTIWGQGKAVILLNEFDNILRFRIYTKNETDKEFINLNLTTEPSFYLAFILDDGTKKMFKQTLNNSVNPLQGEVEFLVPATEAIKILKQKNKNFYIVSKGTGGLETVVYQGLFEHFSKREEVEQKLNNLRESELNKKIKKLKEIENRGKTTEENSTPQKNNEQTTNSNNKTREIPGKSPDLGMNFKSIQPKIKNPSNPKKN